MILPGRVLGPLCIHLSLSLNYVVQRNAIVRLSALEESRLRKANPQYRACTLHLALPELISSVSFKILLERCPFVNMDLLAHWRVNFQTNLLKIQAGCVWFHGLTLFSRLFCYTVLGYQIDPLAACTVCFLSFFLGVIYYLGISFASVPFHSIADHTRCGWFWKFPFATRSRADTTKSFPRTVVG